MSDSLQPHGLQHGRLPCPLPTPRACSKLISIESVIPSNYLILCYPLLLLPSIFPSIRVFSNESVLHNRWLKYWSFSFSISPSNEYSGLISFRIDWFDLLAVQGTLKGLLQYHNSKELHREHRRVSWDKKSRRKPSKISQGTSWWSSASDFTFQFRKYKFDPWSGS